MNKNELKDIYEKVYNDFNFFANNFLKIRTKIQTVEHFILNKEQAYITKILAKQKKKTGKVKALVLKSRQVGITTLIAAYNYHYMLINRGVKSLVLTHRQSATNNIYGVMNRFYKNSPFFLNSHQVFVKTLKYI